MRRALLPLLAAACVDLGYDVDVQPAEGGGGGPGGTGCVEGPAPPGSGGAQVVYRGMAADPPSLVVRPGTVVTWTNADALTHSVVAGAPGVDLSPAQGGFDSGDLATGRRWAFRFCARRTVIYYCRPHAAQMNGYSVVVE